MGLMTRRYGRFTDLERSKEEGQDEIAWLVTLSDLMMLMLTFFVMMFMLLKPDQQEYQKILREIGGALGGSQVAERKLAYDEISDKIQGLIEQNNLQRAVQLTSDSRGIVLFAGGDFFFKSGTAKLTEDVKIFLKIVSAILKENHYKVIIEGHTDDQAIKSAKYPSNWELSTARASAVVRFFTKKMKLAPRRFAAVGYAEHKPRFALIPENRAKNRRVEIIVTREEI